MNFYSNSGSYQSTLQKGFNSNCFLRQDATLLMGYSIVTGVN